MRIDTGFPAALPLPPSLDFSDSDDNAAAAWALVQRSQAGDTAALGELYSHYQSKVYRFIYFRVKDRTLAEDLTQETFLRVIKRIDSFTWQGKDIGAWLVTIARNLVLDYRKSAQCRYELTKDDVTDPDINRSAIQDTTEEMVISGCMATVLYAAIKHLTPEQQECIRLRYLQDLSVAETAAKMGRTEGAVKSLRGRALATLRRVLEENLDEEGSNHD